MPFFHRSYVAVALLVPERGYCPELSRGETICPCRSRRIYVCARTDPQSVQLWWPAGQLRRSWPRRCQLRQTDGQTDRQTDRQTDGRIVYTRASRTNRVNPDKNRGRGTKRPTTLPTASPPPPTMLLALRKAITWTNKQHVVLIARSERLASRIFSRGARFGQLGRLPLGPSQFRPRLLSVLFTSDRSSD